MLTDTQDFVYGATGSQSSKWEAHLNTVSQAGMKTIIQTKTVGNSPINIYQMLQENKLPRCHDITAPGRCDSVAMGPVIC